MSSCVGARSLGLQSVLARTYTLRNTILVASSARLLPFCEAWDWNRTFVLFLAAPASYAAGAKAYRIISFNDGESFENSCASACVCKPHCSHKARRTHVIMSENVTVDLPLQRTLLRVREGRGSCR
jgi:hypothetical protein